MLASREKYISSPSMSRSLATERLAAEGSGQGRREKTALTKESTVRHGSQLVCKPVSPFGMMRKIAIRNAGRGGGPH